MSPHRYGTWFEREAIFAWLDNGNNFCPVTSNPLRPSNLIADKTHQWKIQYFCKKHGIALEAPKKAVAENKEGEQQVAVVGALPPSKFICPLTKKIMKDPVMTRTGQAYERKAILEHLDTVGDICPVTKKELFPSGVVAYNKLQWEIRQWQMKFGDVSECGKDFMSDLELTSKLEKTCVISEKELNGNAYHGPPLEEIVIGTIMSNEQGTSSDNKASSSLPLEREEVLSVFNEVVGTIRLEA